jgi:hypothetical protein
MTTGRINQGAASAVRRGVSPRLGAPQLPGRGDPPRGEPRARDRRRECPVTPKRPEHRATVLVQAAAERRALPSARDGTRPARRRRVCATRFRTVLRDMFETLSEVARIPLAPTDKAGLPIRVPAPHMDPPRPRLDSITALAASHCLITKEQPTTETPLARPETPRYRSTIDRKPPARGAATAAAARAAPGGGGGPRPAGCECPPPPRACSAAGRLEKTSTGRRRRRSS